MKSIVAGSVLAVALAAACSPSTAPVAATPVAPTQEDTVARGKYLAEGASLCGECHTPRLADNTPDLSKPLQGGVYPGAPPPPDSGIPFAPNAVRLASLPDGYTAESLKTFLMNGEPGDGSPPLPPMPPYRFNEADADALVAYISSLPRPPS